MIFQINDTHNIKKKHHISLCHYFSTNLFVYKIYNALVSFFFLIQNGFKTERLKQIALSGVKLGHKLDPV